MTSHQPRTAATHEWLTPRWILDVLGDFDLDPCASVVRPWSTASNHYTINDNGLTKKWAGRVWLNPPFGDKSGAWLARMAEHGNGIALLPARTETRHFFKYVWRGYASGACFIEGRPHFCYTDGREAKFNSGVPMVLVSYDGDNPSDRENQLVLRRCGLGKFVPV